MINGTHRQFKDGLYEQFARIGKALASPKRLEIIDLLAQAERSVEGIAEQLESSIANTSQHLRVLKAARLVDARREGSYVYYRLAGESVFRVWKTMRDVAETNLAEVDRLVETFVHDRGSFEEVSAEALHDLLCAHDVTVLDVRPEAEYRAAHIPGSLSVPVEKLESWLASFSTNGEVVAYCRGPYCLFSDQAVALLRGHGIEARRLKEGLPEWRALGLPVTGGA